MQGILHTGSRVSRRQCRGLLIGWFLLAGLSKAQAAITVTPNHNGLTYQVKIEGVEVNKIDVWGEEYSQVNLKGIEGYEGALYEVGRPGVPAVRFYVEGDGNVVVLPGSDFVEMEKAENLIYPFQKSLAKIKSAAAVFFFNKAAYSEDEFSPKKAFEISDAGSWRGVKRRLVTLYPYFYKPATGEQKYRTEFTVLVGKSKTTPPPPTGRDAMLFIIGKDFKDSASLAQYLQLKRELGFDVFVEAIDDASLGTPEQIRIKIQEYYARKETSLKYVVLVGDLEQVPSYQTKNLLIPDAVTDHYYRSIDTKNYSGDINGPDLGVGRVSVQNESQLKIVLDKYTRYQLGTFRNADWIKKASFIATDDDSHHKLVEASHDFVAANYTKPQAYTGTFPDEDTAAGGDRLYTIRHGATTENLLGALNDGRGIISYSGHGTQEEWEGPAFKIQDLDRIENNDSMPFVFSNACLTAQFNTKESLGEAWQRHPKGGVLFWGSMDNTFWQEDDRLERNIYLQIFKNSKRSIASITNAALAEVWRYYGGDGHSDYYWETYVTLGDPSLEIRTEKPQQAFVMAPKKLPRRSDHIDLRVVGAKGQPLPFVTVAITSEDGNFHAVRKSDATGRVVFAINPRLMRWGKEFSVNLYGNNIVTTSTNLSVGFWKY